MLNLLRDISIISLHYVLLSGNLCANSFYQDTTVLGYTKYRLGFPFQYINVECNERCITDTIKNDIIHSYEFVNFICNTYDSALNIKSSHNIINKSLEVNIIDNLSRLSLMIDSFGNVLSSNGIYPFGLNNLYFNYEYIGDSAIKIEYTQNCCNSNSKDTCLNTDTLRADMSEFEKDPAFGVIYDIIQFKPIIINPNKIRVAFYFRKTGELYMVEEQKLGR